MYLFAIASLFPFLIICNCDCDHKTDKKLLELKSDVEKIGNGFENLAFDVMEQIMDKVRSYEVGGDYETSDESESNEVNTQIPANKKKSENIKEKPNTRPKRSVDDIAPTNFSEASMENVVESNFNNTLCTGKTLEEQALERQHIEDLKEEVKKLYDLVVLLKDQQKIMSLLDQETKDLDSDISKRFDTKDLLTILDHVNNQDTLSDGENSETKRKITGNGIGKKATHEELKQIKFDLRSAISALNRTKEILAMERKKEIDLENELRDHRIELNFLKVMVQKLYENNTVLRPENNVTTDDIVGAPVHLPKELPTKDNLSKSRERSSNITDTVRSRAAMEQKKSRSSDEDDLEKLVQELRKPKGDDLESRMVELKKEMEAKKQEVDLLKQLDTLEKFIADRKEISHKSNSVPEEESDMVKRLLAALKKQRPQNRVIDDDVEVELQKLQNAIDNLRPKDEWVKPKKKDEAQLQKLLSKLLSQEGKKDDGNVGPGGGNNGPQLSPKQISDLKKQLDQMYPSSSAYGYGPQFAGTISGKYTCKLEASPQSNSDINSSDLFGRGPSSQFFSGGYGNLPNPYPLNNNRGMYATPANVPYNSYFPSAVNSFQSQNFGATSNSRPTEIASSSSGYNRNILAPSTNTNNFGGNIAQNGYPVQQRQFGTTGPYNFGTITQTVPDQPKNFIPPPPSLNPYENYQGLSELHQKLFGANSAQNGYTQKETKNQFFLAPQPNETPAQGPVYAQANAAGGSQEKPGYYPQQNTGNAPDFRYQKMEAISSQVAGLQNVINDLNKPGYVQKPEDRDRIVNLEQQINDLKGIMSGLTREINSNSSPVYDPRDLQQDQPNYQKLEKTRRSTENNELSVEDSNLYDQVVSSLRQIFVNDTQREERSSYYDDVQTKISDLKSQLENHMHRSGIGQQRQFSPIYPSNIYQNSYKSPYHEYGPEVPTKLHKIDLIQPKKNDIFTSIVLKILDKILSTVPAVLQRLFGFGINQFFNYEDGDNTYGVGYGGQYGIQGIFKSLGIFGYLPLIFLKIIDGVTIFVNILKKNKFFKNFLLPALVLLLVAGSVVFLIWWLQPNKDSFSQQGIGDNSYNNYGQYSSNSYQNYGYNNKPNYGSNDNYGPPKRSYNYPVYSRSYFENNR